MRHYTTDGSLAGTLTLVGELLEHALELTRSGYHDCLYDDPRVDDDLEYRDQLEGHVTAVELAVEALEHDFRKAELTRVLADLEQLTAS